MFSTHTVAAARSASKRFANKPRHPPFIERNPNVKVLFINNDGSGFADHIEIEDNTSVQTLFNQRIGKGKESNYLIRVNRQPVASNQVLIEGDRISITPVKIEGAQS